MDATNQTQPEVIDYPTIKIKNKEYTVKLTCGKLMQLKRAGIDLFSTRPPDSHVTESVRLLNQARAIKPETEGAELSEEQIAEQQRLVKASNAEWELAAPEARNWEHPMECSDFTQKMENTFAVLAVAISTKGRTFTAEEIAEEVDPGVDLLDIMLKVGTATKKALNLIESAVQQTVQERIRAIQSGQVQSATGSN